MIKVVEFFRRRADLSRQAFLTHWQERHTQVVLGIDGLRRYVQNPVVERAGLEVTPFDGVVEVWFDSLEVMRANARSTYWQKVVEDEERFIDRASAQFLLIERIDQPLVVPAPKVMLLLHRADRPTADFQELVAAAIDRLRPVRGLRGIETDHPVLSTYERPRAVVADAVLSIRFDRWDQAGEALAAKAFEGLTELDPQPLWLAVDERLIKQ